MDVRAIVRNGVYVLTAWLFAVLYVAGYQFPDPDLWGRLSMGALFFQNGRFPYHDVFSYTAPHAPWVDHEWLTGLVFYQILDKAGEFGFLAFKYGMMLAIVYLLFRLHRKAYRASALYALYGLIVTVGVYSVGLYATVRSHLFSFFFFVLFLYLLERVRLGQRGKRLLWLLLPLGVIWGNLHGGFAMGLILLALYGLGACLEKRSLKAGLSYGLLAAGIFLALGVFNPYGLKYLAFLWHAWTLNRSHIGEWSAFRFELWYFLPAQVLMVICSILLLLRWLWRDNTPSPVAPSVPAGLITPALVLVAMMAMVVKGVRFQPFLAWAAVAYAPILFPPAFLKRFLPEKVRRFGGKQTSAFQNTLPALLLLGTLAGLFFFETHVGLFQVALPDELTLDPHPQIRYPLGLVQFLKASPYHGNLVVRFGLGEFAYWALYPRFKVSMDGRYEEVYDQAEFLRNHEFYDKKEPLRSQNTVAPVTNSPADFILTEPDIPSTALLLRDPAWALLEGNNYYLLFAKVRSLHALPPFNPQGHYLPIKNLTIQNYVTPADKARFREP
jgi:hypothetical protein